MEYWREILRGYLKKNVVKILKDQVRIYLLTIKGLDQDQIHLLRFCFDFLKYIKCGPKRNIT
jgi:hypothetical protein